MAYYPSSSYQNTQDPSNLPSKSLSQFEKALHDARTPLDQDPFWEQQLGGVGVGSAIGVGYLEKAKASQTKEVGLKADSVFILEQSLTLQRLLNELFDKLFEPTPSDAQSQNLKDNPDSVEGNLREATLRLSNVTVNLESVLSKIGGR